jgi:hypothetical protein
MVVEGIGTQQVLRLRLVRACLRINLKRPIVLQVRHLILVRNIKLSICQGL